VRTPPRRGSIDGMLDPRLRLLYNPQLVDRSRLDARQARRIALAARDRHEVELRRRPALGGSGRPGNRRPRLAAMAMAAFAAVACVAVTLAASAGIL